jgi:putative membrane protein
MESLTVAQSLAGLTDFFLHFLAASLLAALFCVVYIRVTPFPEFRLIHEGKTAPAVSLGGALLGFVIPLAGAIVQSVSFLDMVIWSLVALVLQLLVFFLLRACFSDLSRKIAEDQMAPALLLAVLSLSAGIISAACMTY